MQTIPTIEELNQHLRDHKAREYCMQFQDAVNQFFYTGNKNRRKRTSNKPVEYLTELIWMFMAHAVEGLGFQPNEKRRIKAVRKHIEAAIAAVPTQDTMAIISSARIESQKKAQLTANATFRAGHAIMALDQLYEPWSFSELMNNIVGGGAYLRFNRDKTQVVSRAFFFEVADILRQNQSQE